MKFKGKEMGSLVRKLSLIRFNNSNNESNIINSSVSNDSENNDRYNYRFSFAHGI